MNKYSEVFEKNGQLVILKKAKGESRRNFIIRGRFILDNLNKYPLEKLICKSYIFVNMIVNKNTYDLHIAKKFKEEFNVNLV